MSKKICLTAKQQEAFNFIKRFHKENGRFPNSPQLATGLGKKVGAGTYSQVTQLYGALLLKGAFTNGTPVSDGIYNLHSGGNIASLNIAELTFKPQKVERAASPSTARNAQAAADKDAALRTGIANALIRLLQQDKGIAESLSAILGS